MATKSEERTTKRETSRSTGPDLAPEEFRKPRTDRGGGGGGRGGYGGNRGGGGGRGGYGGGGGRDRDNDRYEREPRW